ncbi:hypothetical protein ACFPA8_02600 [Streptomyces ovatisporus]|uniref:Uncharacterized protein n=1 Tax=Streptomyces ovatisporus TaxID=1128682 RepID=A0ABV9A0B8_9ACTN
MGDEREAPPAAAKEEAAKEEAAKEEAGQGGDEPVRDVPAGAGPAPAGPEEHEEAVRRRVLLAKVREANAQSLKWPR